jgi:Putative  PD-(D/E)XK family member, (DUF4420)
MKKRQSSAESSCQRPVAARINWARVNNHERCPEYGYKSRNRIRQNRGSFFRSAQFSPGSRQSCRCSLFGFPLIWRVIGFRKDLQVPSTDLARAFADLRPPSQAAGRVEFSAIDIPECGEHKLAKSVDSHPSLLIRTTQPYRALPPPIRLEHITVEHGLRAMVHTETRTEEGFFSIVVLRATESAFENLFLRLAPLIAADMGSTPEPEIVARGLRRLVEMFEALKQSSRGTTQGLWSELVVIDRAIDPTVFVPAWHTDPSDRCDFSSTSWRLDVKSAAGRVRRHHFSLEQLLARKDSASWIASLFAEQASGGRSIADLLVSIQSKLPAANSRVRLNEIALATLGAAWEQGLTARFDYELAVESLACFQAQDVPRVDENLPVGVSGVVFWSDISSLSGIPFDTWQRDVRAIRQMNGHPDDS